MIAEPADDGRATPPDPAPPGPGATAARTRPARPRRPQSSRDTGDRSCRRSACRHLDCMMDRGEPMPDWVVSYQDGVRYHDAATRARAREEAVRLVDGRRGYAIEFSSDPAAHRLDYDEEQDRILDEIARQVDLAYGRPPRPSRIERRR